MDHDFYEWASDAHLRAPDGFSEMATAAGVSASVAERNEMLAYALRTFSRGHAQLLARILSGYESARKLQVRGMAAYMLRLPCLPWSSSWRFRFPWGPISG